MKLQWYFARQLLATTALCAAALLALVALVRLGRYLEKALNGDIDAAGIIPILLWRTPDFLSQLLPFALLVAALLCLWRMRDNGELTSMNVCGVHAGRLTLCWLAAALPVAALTAVCSLHYAPQGQARVESMLSDSKQLGLVNTLQAGAFYRQRDLVVHAAQVRRRDDIVELGDIFLAEGAASPQRMLITTAEDGFIRHGHGGGFQLLLRRGATYRGLFEDGSRSRSSFTQLRRDLDNPWRSLQTVDDVEARPTLALWRSTAPGERATLQARLSAPLMTFTALLLAMSAGLGGGVGGASKARTLSGLSAALLYLIYAAALGAVTDAAGDIAVWPLHWPLHVAILLAAALWPGGAWRLRRL